MTPESALPRKSAPDNAKGMFELAYLWKKRAAVVEDEVLLRVARF